MNLATPKPEGGRVIVVVGPSGAGKDSLINRAAVSLANHDGIRFQRRVITRPRDGATEDHDSATPDAFIEMAERGAFAVSWTAHGLHYGIPADACDFVAGGGIAICNGSRKALPLFRDAFTALTVINVTATPDILAARLQARGRESREEILNRLSRANMAVHGDFDVISIDNSGDLDTAAAMFITTLRAYLPS
ncbi:phosphonate metabolism protein/1,5-bisphosphokinase (PRPP-forming) PhnN [Martelella alba]|uniref:phosphonate metabolism protein/1,5-bisphosphokinase (PRPP-forming) PhnN n=1 Tax=Martelella alba TaxID=2590451 RepID=UPI0015E87113|nr:phosphonate metabolism protein/1,5-bisphosphokinase (PRPP-forming) PhnN [Martelella alba]